LAAQHEARVTALVQLVNGFQVSQATYVAATLGIADLLAAGPRTSDELAAETDTDPRSLYARLGGSGGDGDLAGLQSGNGRRRCVAGDRPRARPARGTRILRQSSAT
jgi:hypothetical protein